MPTSWFRSVRSGSIPARRRLAVLALVAGFVTATTVSISPASATATTSCPTGLTLVDGVCTTTFSYTGAPQTFTVPSGVSSLVAVVGGGVGGTNGTGLVGGWGGEETATLPVTDGESLTIVAGGQGIAPVTSSSIQGIGGYGGGGAGTYEGGGGGGGSFVFGPSNTLLVAAGGGGGNAGYTLGGMGGNGGGTSGGLAGGNEGKPLEPPFVDSTLATGGGGATATSPGAAGPAGYSTLCGEATGGNGGAGAGPTTSPTSMAVAGGGANPVHDSCAPGSGGGGGGGGGYYAGGGGGGGYYGGGGGGGGSGYVEPAASGASSSTNTTSDTGFVTLSLPGCTYEGASALRDGPLALVCPITVAAHNGTGSGAPGPVRVGTSWLQGGTIGFKIDSTEGTFIQSCASGCANISATVLDENGDPIGGATLTATVTSVDPSSDLIAPQAGLGHLCIAASLGSGQNADGPCGTTVTSDSRVGSPGDGEVNLRYWAPPVYVGTDSLGRPNPDPKVTITLKATSHVCTSTCFIQKSSPTTVAFDLEPHPIYEVPAVQLTNVEQAALIDWAKTGSITTGLKGLDAELTKLKVLNKVLPKRYLDAFVHLVPFYDQVADLVMLELFDTKFHVTEDGLTNIGLQALTQKLISYVKNPQAQKVLSWLSAHFIGASHDYPSQMIQVLKDYGDFLWHDQQLKTTRLVTLRIFEASYCYGDYECRGPAPAVPPFAGNHYNLYVAFSSTDAGAPGTDIFYRPFLVDTAYAAPTWIPAQCTSKAHCLDHQQ